jgi:hypothetical protein
MSIKELEDEIAEIENIKERCKPSLQWNNIENIILEKKREQQPEKSRLL